MESVLTPAQMAATDRQAIASGISEATLIGRAGVAVAWHARRMLGGTYGGRVVVVCGKGNNGADGRVAAGLLARWGAGVDIVDLAEPPDARRLSRVRSIAATSRSTRCSAPAFGASSTASRRRSTRSSTARH